MTELSFRVDRSSPVPLYYQLAQQLEQAITDGRLAAGDRLENELDLAERFGLSRPTVRQAIQELVRQGLLVRKRGVGTQVVHGQVKRPVELSSLYDDPRSQRPATDHPGAGPRAGRRGRPPRWCTRIAIGVPVLRIERLRSAGDQPLADHAQLAASRPRGLHRGGARTAGSLRAAPTQRRTHPDRHPADRRPGRLAAGGPPPERAQGAPLLTMERTAYDDSGRAVEFGSHAYRAETYSFEVTLVER